MYEWILFSFIAALAISLKIIIIHYVNIIGDKKYLEFYIFLSFLCINILLLIYLLCKPRKINLTMFKKNPLLLCVLFAVSILAIITVYFSSMAHMVAPNPAYSATIVNFNVVFVLLLSMYFFNSPINMYTGIGIFLVLCGVIMISIYSNKNSV